MLRKFIVGSVYLFCLIVFRVKRKGQENIKKRGLRGPFIVTRIGNELVTYTDFNRLIAVKEMGKELVPCVIISNELMNKRINRLNRYRRYDKLKTI